MRDPAWDTETRLTFDGDPAPPSPFGVRLYPSLILHVVSYAPALTRLGFTTPASARNTVLRRIRDAGWARAFPPLTQMVTFPDWIALARRFDQEAFYGHAWMATQLLIDRHGVAKVISYFERFAQSDDRLANFREAFGEDLSQFEAAAAASLAR